MVGLGQLLGGRYQIVNVLGSGGFGQTYTAQDMQRPGNPMCVVKHLKPSSTDPEFLQVARKLFLAEAEVLERLGRHDQIPRLLAYFEENQEFYLVQEFVEGQDLSEEVLSGQLRSESAVIQVLKDILRVLQFVHHENVIHRDIKPANLIRRASDRKIVLIDFGAVKQLRGQAVTGAGETNLTIAIGSPGYIPSEQVSGKPKFASDIYAVGLVAIQGLTGISPQHLQQDPATSEILWRDRAQVSPQLAAVLDKMVCYDFRQRYPSATEALAALEQVQIKPLAQQVATSVLQPISQTLLKPEMPAVKVRADRPPLKQLKPAEIVAVLAVLVLGGSLFLMKSRLFPSTQQLLPILVTSSPPQMTPFEWAQSVNLVDTIETQTPIYALIVSPNGRLLAGGGADGLIKVWNAQTGERISSLADHKGVVRTLAISLDSQTLVSGSDDKTIKIWNVQTGKVIHTLLGHTAAITSVTIGSDGKTVVSGSEDQTIRVWDLQTGQLIHTVAGVSQGVTSVAISPSLQKLAATTDDDTIQLWDMESHQSMPPLISEYPVSYVRFSPDGQTLVTGSADGIRLWDVQTGALIRTIPQNFASLMSVAINPNGSMLVSGTDHRANQVKIWDAHTGELLNTLEGHTYSISAVAFSPDGQTIYSGSIDSSIRIWRSKTQAQAKCLESSTCSQVVAH